MSTTFSIIVPCYNVDPYIGSCLESVATQNYQSWECVVVDDGSPDDSGRIADEFASRDLRFKVIHQKNQGEGGARNSGIESARGMWIFFLDGDDEMAPGALEHLNQIIARYPNEKMIRFGYESYRDGTVWTPTSVCVNVIRKNVANEIQMVDFFTYACQHLYRSDVIRSVRFKNYKRGCDRVFVDGVLLNNTQSFVETNQVLYGYRQRETSAMHKAPTTQVLLDEMSHRRDIVLMIEKSRKTVNYAGSGWLEGYFIYAAWRLAARKDKADRKILHDEWFRQICQMADAKGISRFARFVFRTCRKFPCVPTWWCLCRLFPLYIHYGIIPRSRRVARRLFRCDCKCRGLDLDGRVGSTP